MRDLLCELLSCFNDQPLAARNAPTDSHMQMRDGGLHGPIVTDRGKELGGLRLTDGTCSQNRYFVRKGGKGWMVYDRERKGPALIGADLAANLTVEQAERIKRMLTASRENKV
ncbi:hypothetical protein [Bradyrhizobium sp. Rc3b]|uniref:hypothetical protein n=1 Tax=Bradyrhizobium sp. Rc3b TaxID=1855322 RepID=UPI0011601B80|nr:hypothetical protein [Bradyrhizobium sp. Rc3b]